ncbi:hypothetical protein M406DRAFT_346908 [Cryphonectria parasitica EP155]|uniref:Uncharacterized protein n=1 Tax=Cryphonectria parasitica (strain ATCC 38755 / EP155) TaxID=660469 RepID=A0A9P5CN80_CRYP1|nr:uncharacterized protein M406DRAFT_346908 [Cryphonectria parasitica EP155]KAF3765169.1 hypothetical protein M406DRAFT_346908 [Cryphonectria parasitica EP155]
MSYYGDSQWPAGTQPAGAWDHQTPPTRSGASSAIPREETSAFWYQFEEVERAIENLVKSGKMFGVPGARHPRNSGGPQRPHSVEFDGRPGHPSSNLQNFYASQRHQSSRGSNEAEQMMQHKRRMAAQRERELRNYHQEQQFNRILINSANPVRPDRNLSPGNLSEEARRELIARQRSALYGEGPFADTGGYIDETGAPRQGLPATHHGGSASLRGPSPLAYEYSRNAPAHPDVGAQSSADPASGGAQQPSRTSSNASPQSNPGPKGPLEQTTRTSNSSPGGGSPQNAKPPAGKTVAPIGTRPSGPSSNQGPAKHAPGANEAAGNSTSTGPVNTSSTTTSGEGSTPLGNWGQRGGPWGPKTQTSVWG